MTRFAIIVILLLSICSRGYSQLPTPVTAPIAEAALSSANATLTTQVSIQTTMATVMQAIEEGEKAYKEVMKQATWVRNLQSAQRLLYMIENLVCTSKDLNVKLSVRGESCMYSYRYDMMIVKLQMSVDYLGIILSGVSMTVAERAKTLNDASKTFEESQEMMVAMNRSLDDDAAHEAMVQQTTKEVHDFMNYDRSKKAPAKR
jgi:hypothetical protein